MERLAERLGDIKRSFKTALVLGQGTEALVDALRARGVAFPVTADSVMGPDSTNTVTPAQAGVPRESSTLFHAPRDPGLRRDDADRTGPESPPALPQTLVLDEESWPFAGGVVEAILSVLTLHTVNDLPGALAQARNALTPGGVFLGALVGGASLQELRTCLADAESALTGQAPRRVAPMVDVMTAGALLRRAGFELPLTDRETLTLVVPDLTTLLRRLHERGEGFAPKVPARGAHLPLRRDVLAEAERLYAARFPGPSGEGLSVTAEVIFLHGWRPEQTGSDLTRCTAL